MDTKLYDGRILLAGMVRMPKGNFTITRAKESMTRDGYQTL
jgi:hypothetical protein